MNYNHPARHDSTIIIKVMCAVVFVVFSFLWLYFFQADLLAVVQHMLSHGQTSYNRLVGAVLITAILQLLQTGVYSLARLRKYSHALTYFPSMLVLAVLTSAGQNMTSGMSFGRWLWLLPLLLVVWVGTVWMARKVQPYESGNRSGLFSRPMWINMLIMVLMTVGVTAASNTNAVFHFRSHVETALLAHDYDEALRVGDCSLETDGNLMMLRMYALSRKGQLGEHLFEYPLLTSSDAMLPTGGTVCMMRYPTDSLYRHVGVIPRHPMHPMEYLKTIIRSKQAKPAAIDYLLCGYLIDKDLDSFAREIGNYYTVNDSLPRYYREALVLYTHRRSHPVVVYHDAVLDVDYQDLQQLEAQHVLPSERKGKVLEYYANSYWYYFEYTDK